MNDIKDRKAGQPTIYNDMIHPQIALDILSDGGTYQEVADACGVSVSSIKNWRKAHSEFLSACKTGNAMAVSKVEKKLFETAIGGVEIVKTVTEEEEGRKRVRTEKATTLPNVTAQKFFLINRSRSFKEKSSVEVGGIDGKPIAMSNVDYDSLPEKEAEKMFDELIQEDDE